MYLRPYSGSVLPILSLVVAEVNTKGTLRYNENAKDWGQSAGRFDDEMMAVLIII